MRQADWLEWNRASGPCGGWSQESDCWTQPQQKKRQSPTLIPSANKLWSVTDPFAQGDDHRTDKTRWCSFHTKLGTDNRALVRGKAPASMFHLTGTMRVPSWSRWDHRSVCRGCFTSRDKEKRCPAREPFSETIRRHSRPFKTQEAHV